MQTGPDEFHDRQGLIAQNQRDQMQRDIGEQDQAGNKAQTAYHHNRFLMGRIRRGDGKASCASMSLNITPSIMRQHELKHKSYHHAAA